MSRTTSIISPGILCLSSVAILVLLLESTQAAPPDSAQKILPAAGPLRVHPTNPRYFTDGTKTPDGALRAVYLTGSHHWSNLQDSAKLGQALTNKFDYEGYLALPNRSMERIPAANEARLTFRGMALWGSLEGSSRAWTPGYR